MRSRTWSAASLAVALIFACALPAHADNYPVRDGTGASQTFCSKLVTGLQYPCHLLYGMFGSTPTPITSDGSNLNVHVQASELPNGAATATNQATANGSLSSINTKIPSQGPAAKSASTPVTMATDQFQATSTPAAITITTALTFQSVLASSGTRKGCLVQNTSGDVEYVFFGANGSASTGASLQLQPGQAISCNASGVVLTDNISMTSSATNGATAVVVSQ